MENTTVGESLECIGVVVVSRLKFAFIVDLAAFQHSIGVLFITFSFLYIDEHHICERDP